MDSTSILSKLAIDTEVCKIADKDVILELSWLAENRSSVDTQDSCLWNVNIGQIILVLLSGFLRL